MSGPVETAGMLAPTTPTRGLSIAEAEHAKSRDMDETRERPNDDEAMTVRFCTSVTACGLGENWEDITHVSHTPSGPTRRRDEVPHIEGVFLPPKRPTPSSTGALLLRDARVRAEQQEVDAKIAEECDPVEVALSGPAYVAAAIRGGKP